MTLKNPQSLEEMLRKSPASNVWFFLELFKSYKIELQSRHFINNHSRDLRASNCSRECQLNRAEPREVKHNSQNFVKTNSKIAKHNYLPPH